MTDGELVRQALTAAPAPSSAAYGQLARRWAPRVMATCHARVGSAGAAEDLTQEALLRGLRALSTLAEPDKFGPWLCGIASRVCLDWLKSAQRRETSLDTLAAGNQAAVDFPSLGDDVADLSARREEASQLMAEVARLPHAYREVLMRYYYEHCTYQELAAQLGVSAATVNARLTKARMMLRSRLAVDDVKER